MVIGFYYAGVVRASRNLQFFVFNGLVYGILIKQTLKIDVRNSCAQEMRVASGLDIGAETFGL